MKEEILCNFYKLRFKNTKKQKNIYNCYFVFNLQEEMIFFKIKILQFFNTCNIYDMFKK